MSIDVNTISDFWSFFRKLIGTIEGDKQFVYNDTEGVATIAVGVSSAYARQILAAIGVNPNDDPKSYNAMLADLQTDQAPLHGKIVPRASFQALLTEWARKNNITIDPTHQITGAAEDNLLKVPFSNAYRKVQNKFPWLVDSKEKAVLMSLAHQGSPISNPSLVSAINKGDRALAWYALRYLMSSVHHKGRSTYVGARRYLESEQFGLYKSGVGGKASLLDALDAYAVLSSNGRFASALNYDASHSKYRSTYAGRNFKAVLTLKGELSSAVAALSNQYDVLAPVAYSNIYASSIEHTGHVLPTGLQYKSSENTIVIGQGSSEVIESRSTKSSILVARGQNDTLIGGSGFNAMVADGSFVHTTVTATGSARVSGNVFLTGSGNNLIIAQGTQNQFNIDNSKQSINIVFDGDGGNTYNLLSPGEVVLSISASAMSITQAESFAASLKFMWDTVHQGALLVIINGKNDAFTVNNHRVGNNFQGGTLVAGMPSAGFASEIQVSGFSNEGSIGLYLGNHEGARTILSSNTTDAQTARRTSASPMQAESLLGGAPASSSPSGDVLASSSPGQIFNNFSANSTLIGLGGGDLFKIASHLGSINIVESDFLPSPNNVLEFDEAVTKSSLKISADKFGDILLDTGNGDVVTLDGALESENGNVKGVQSVKFADGSSLSYRDIVKAADTGSSANLSLFGDADANVFDSQGFASYAQGAGGGDTFVYNAGYGALEINEVDSGDAPANVLAFGTGIDASSVGVTGDANGNLILALSSTDRITLDGALNNADGTTYGVQKVTFADGTVWSYADLLSRAEAGSSVTSRIYGDTSANLLDSHGREHFAQGGGGGDTFVYNRGYGLLTIAEADTSTSPANVLRLGAGITPSSITVTADANGSLLLNLGNGDLITIQNALNSAGATKYGVQQVQFADGSSWSSADLISRAETGSASDTHLYGGTGAETFDSKGMATYERGGGGGDNFLYRRGYGALTIDEHDTGTNPANVLSFGTGIASSDVHVSANGQGDLLLDLGNGDRITLTGVLARTYVLGNDLGAAGVQKVQFSDGTSWSLTQLIGFADAGTATNKNLYGNAGANTFHGNGFATYEQGGGGGDTFVYDSGDGALTINEIDDADRPANVLSLGAGIDPTGVTATVNVQGDIILSLGGKDVVTLKSMAVSAHAGVQAVRFADGTVWDAAQIIASTGSGANLGTIIMDPPAASAAIGSGYYDTGSFGIRDIDVRASAPHAVDAITINDYPWSYQVSAVADSDDILVTGSDGGGVRLVGALADGGVHFPTITFSDGTTWTYSQLAQKLETPDASSEPGIFGDSGANILDTQGLTNFAQGGGGGDTFVYAKGYGALEIAEVDAGANPANVLALAAGIAPADVSVSADANGNVILDLGGADRVTVDKALLHASGAHNGVQRIQFNNGTTWTYADLLQNLETPFAGASGIYGDDQANLLDTKGLTGFVQGGGGGDTFVYNAGYGALEISESDISSNAMNTLAFGAGIASTQVSVTTDGSGNIILTLGGTDQVTIDQALSNVGGTSHGVQRVTFTDGTVWTAAQLASWANDGATDHSRLIGTSGADRLDSAGKANYVEGRGGGDTFVYGRGYGAVEINEGDTAGSAHNVLSFGTGIDPSQVDVSSDGNGAILLDLGGGDVVTLDNALTSGGGTTWGVQQITFANGTHWSYADLIAKLGTASGAPAIVSGAIPGSVIDPQGTASYAIGQGGGDTFAYNQGYGRVTISEFDAGATPHNRLSFGSGISASDVTVSADTAGDILLSLDDDDVVVLRDALNSAQAISYGVQSVSFADGTTWSYADLLSKVANPVAGADGIYGDGGANHFDTQGLTHYVQGDGGNDTFVFNRGYGSLEINEVDHGSAPNNVLTFGAGIAAGDVSVGSDANGNIVLTLSATDRIVIDNALESDTSAVWGVQTVIFQDGTRWTSADLLAKLAASASSSVAIGTSGADTLSANGKNYLVGNGGNDTFTYASGDGYVTIDERDATANPANILSFGAGISAGSVIVSADATDDLVLTLSSSDVVVLRGALKSSPSNAYGVQKIAFADGTSWSYADLLAKVSTPSGGANGVYGDASANRLDTLGQVAIAQGGGGGDTFVYNRGYGALQIEETDYSTRPTNVLAFGAGINPGDIRVSCAPSGDLLLSLGGADQITIEDALNSGAGTTFGVQHVTFQDGTSWSLADLISRAAVGASGGIYGDSGANVLDTRGLAPYAQGHGGGDTFVYDRNYGALEIDETDTAASPDNILAFGPGVTATSLTVSGDSEGNLVLSLGGSDIVTVDGALTSSDGTTRGIQSVTFSDGTSLSYNQLVQRAATGSAANPSIYGDGSANVLDSHGAATYAQGNGGGDTFVYDRGYGALEINEVDGAATPNNVLAFGAGIDPSQVTVAGDSAGDLVLTLGAGDQVTLDKALLQANGGANGVQKVTFANGTVWTYADLLAKAGIASSSASGIYGDAGANLLDTHGLTHFAQGNGGGDTFTYNTGYGALEINEVDAAGLPNNVLALGGGIAPSQVVVSGDAAGNIHLSLGGNDTIILDGALNSVDGTTYGVQKVKFFDGTVWSYTDLLTRADTASATNISLYGDAGANVLDSLGRARTEQGNGGADTFVYHRGYGALAVSDTGVNNGEAVVALGSGITPSNVTASVNAKGDILLDLGNGDVITLMDAAPGGDGAGAFSVQFENGQRWSAEQLTGLATGSVAFTPGSGTMVIDLSADGASTPPSIVVGPGLTASDFSVEASAGSPGDILLKATNGDTIVLRNALTTASASTETVRFSDGSGWTYAQMLAQLETARSGGSGVVGDAGANRLDTLGLVPYAAGNGGNDTFVYNSGYGATEIDEIDRGSNPANVLSLGNGITPAQVKVTGDAGGDLILSLGNGDVIKIDRALAGGAGVSYGVQQVKFADGTTWSYGDLVAKAANGSNGTGAVYGDSGANSLDTTGLASTYSSALGQMAGYVQGGGGGDTIVYKTGYGAVEINETDSTTSPNNVLSMGAGITASQVSVSTTYSGGSLILTVNDGNWNDRIVLDNALNATGGQSYGVQSVTFADGTIWSALDLKKRAEKGSSSHTALVGGTGADYFDPAGWATTMQGNGGGDTFFYDEQYGTVHVNELDTASAPMNVVTFGADIDPSLVTVSWDQSGALILGVNDSSNSDRIILDNELNSAKGMAYGVQQARFADGTTWSLADMVAKANAASPDVIGTSDADLLDTHGLHAWWLGNRGVATGGGGNDTFVFNAGYGVLEINEVDGGAAPQNVLRFGSGINSSQATVSGDEAGNLVIDLGNGDQVVLDKALLNAGRTHYGVQKINFADGTTWTYQDLLNRALTPVSGGARVAGDSGANLIDTGGLVGEAVGNGGGDTFVYNSGYGDLAIDEIDRTGNPHNVLTLGAGIRTADITVSADSSGNLLLTVAGNGTIKLMGGVNANSSVATDGVQQVRFYDGTTWSYADMMARAVTGSASNTVLYGGSQPLTFDGHGFATKENGNSGGDEFIYNQGYGSFTINESGGRDGSPASVLSLGSGITPADLAVANDGAGNMTLTIAGQGTITVTGEFAGGVAGIQKVVFAGGGSLSLADLQRLSDVGSPGNTRLIGTSAAETFDSAGYAKYIKGGGGDDTFIYKSGYGPVEIDEDAGSYTQTRATLQFDGSITAVNLGAHLTKDGTLILTDGVSGDQISIDKFGRNDINTNYSDEYGISDVTFADGTSLSQAQLLQIALTPTPTSTTIYGSAGNDLLAGGSYARFEDGGAGNDTYMYHAGDGVLEIGNQNGSTSYGDVLKLGTGIQASDLSISGDENGNIVIKDGVHGDSITVDGMLNASYNGYTEGLHEVDFADGSILSAQQVLAKAMIGSPTNTIIYGSTQADLIDGKGYATIEHGGLGADTFIYNLGYGHVEIDEQGSWGTSATLQLGAGLTAADLTYSFDSQGNVTITDGTHGDRIVLDKELTYENFGFGDGEGENNYGVSSINFADGTSITQADLMQLAVTGSPTNTSLYGVNKPEAFDPKGFAHFAQGVSGADTFTYAAGYGGLEIKEDGGTGVTSQSVLAFTGSVTAANISVHGTASGALVLTDGTSGDAITLDQQLAGDPDAGSEFGVSQVTFSNGDTLTARQLVNLATTGSVNNTTLYGSAGADTIDSKGVAHVVYGGGGSDTYAFNSGYGELSINNIGSDGVSGTANFGEGITEQNLWFQQSGNDLEVDVLGTNDKILVRNWYAADTDKLQTFASSDGETLDYGSVDQLVQAMATFASSHPSFSIKSTTTMPNDTTLQSAISASWHS